MPVITATLLSALAAILAAISSFLIWRFQRQNLLESVRPELVLTGWSRKRSPGDRADIVQFSSIKNIGRGPALHVTLNASEISENRPVFIMSTARFPILARDEEISIAGDIRIWSSRGRSTLLFIAS